MASHAAVMPISSPVTSVRLPLLRRLSITRRLLVLAFVGPVALVATIAIGLHEFNVLKADAAAAAVDVRLVNEAQAMRYQAADWNGWQTAYAFDALRGVKNAAADTGDSRAAFLASAAALEKGLTTLLDDPALRAQEKEQATNALAAYNKFMALDKQVQAGYASGTAAGFTKANDLVIGAEIDNFQAITDQLNSLSSAITALGVKDAQASADSAATGRTTLLLVGLAGGLLAIGLALAISSSIRRPLGALDSSIRALAEEENADLTARLDIAGQDELASIASSFNTFVARVQGVVRTVSASTETVGAASTELSAVSGEISAAATEAAAQVGVVSSSADMVSANVRTVALGTDEMESAIRDISQSAAEAAGVAAQAVDAARSTTATVVRLGQSSREIGDVVKVITEIAAQTNLLALNATVETWLRRPRRPPTTSRPRSS